MRKRLALRTMLIACVLIPSCTKEGIGVAQTNNAEFRVTYLFTIDSCRVYRFYDGGYTRYLTTCNGSVQWQEMHGKVSHPQEIQTGNTP